MAVPELILQAQDGGFHVISPVTARCIQQTLDSRAVDHVLPIIPVYIGDQIRYAKRLFTEMGAIAVGQRHDVVGAWSGNQQDFAVYRDHVYRATLVIDMTPHQVDAAWGAHDGDRAFVAIALHEGIQSQLKFRPGHLRAVAVRHLLPGSRGRGLQQVRPTLRFCEGLFRSFAEHGLGSPFLLAIHLFNRQEFLWVVERHQGSWFQNFTTNDSRRLLAFGKDLEHVREILLLVAALGLEPA